MESPPLPLASLKTNSSRRDWKGGSFEPLLFWRSGNRLRCYNNDKPRCLAPSRRATPLNLRRNRYFRGRLNFELRTWSWGIEIERESSAAIDRTRGYLKFNSNSHESIESRFGAIRLHPRFFKSGRGSGRSVNNYRIQKSGGKVWNLFKCEDEEMMVGRALVEENGTGFCTL